MDFNVGDKVRIRNDLHEDEYYGKVYFNPDMSRYRGEEMTIDLVDREGYDWVDGNCVYFFVEDNHEWMWSSAMIAGLAELLVEIDIDVSDFL